MLQLRSIAKDFRINRQESSLFRSSFLSMFLLASGSALAVGVKVIIARLLGVEEYGIFAFALVWANILRAIGLFGFEYSVMRFIPKYVAEQNWPYMRGFLKYCFKYPLLLTFVIMFSVVTFASITTNRENHFVTTFLLVALYIPADVFMMLFHKIFLSLKHVILAQTLQYILRPPLVLGTIILGFFLVGLEIQQAPVMMFAYALVTMLIVIIEIAYAWRLLPRAVFNTSSKQATQDWNKVARDMGFIYIANLIAKHIDLIIVGVLLGTTQAGIYSAVVTLVTLLEFGFEAANHVIAPSISEAHTQDNYHRIQQVVRSSVLAIMIFAFLALVMVIVAGRLVLGLFGEEFLAGYNILLIMVFGKMINSLAGPVESLLMMTGNQRMVANIFGISAVIGIVSGIILTLVWGLEGAAIASITGVVLWNILMVTYAIRKTGIDPTIFSLVSRAATRHNETLR